MAVADKYRRRAQTWLGCLGLCLSAAASHAQAPAKPGATEPASAHEQGAQGAGSKGKDAGTSPPSTKRTKKNAPAAQSGTPATPTPTPTKATADAAAPPAAPAAPAKPVAPPSKPACSLTDPEQPRGGRLELVTEHFGSAPVVRINGKPARMLERRETRVSVQIPADSDGGPITVQQDGHTLACGTLVIIGKNR
jgi:hypothetical protein